jgi:hypothetical protein
MGGRGGGRKLGYREGDRNDYKGFSKEILSISLELALNILKRNPG